MATAAPSIADFVRGVWRNECGNRWLLPLAIFLGLTGILLVLASTVEVFAPFIYTIF